MNSEQQRLLDKINLDNKNLNLDSLIFSQLTEEQFLEIFRLGYLGALSDIKMFCNSRS